MQICGKCQLLCEEICPKCGSAKHLRGYEENEPALLIVLTAMQAMLVEPILAESGVPYIKKGEAGGALAAQVGMMREIYRFYVPCSAMERCRSLIEEVFGEDEGIMHLLHEFDAEKKEEQE